MRVLNGYYHTNLNAVASAIHNNNFSSYIMPSMCTQAHTPSRYGQFIHKPSDQSIRVFLSSSSAYFDVLCCDSVGPAATTLFCIYIW